ncbi:hypothetical protein FRC14_000195 [Serendipita sp. 396]|nr:hypothetical protein FRC14_000195 [Serendipita sp. 396]KAG8787252.1 hypothetical protein FRC15_009651 [Serendipita sp. 397]KAG8867718.1 hypothetical protein FRC20_005088 [Serendipita sp. 405]
MSEISIYQRLHSRAYLEKFLEQKLRPDGRGLDEFRPLQVTQGSISTADGSALVRLGEMTVVCGVKAEISEPDLDLPNSGFIVPNVEISAICAARFKPGPPSEEAQILSEQLNQIILKSGVLPPESLCIQPGKAVWVLYIDAICINYDGNALDATLLAMMLALTNTRLPQARYDEEQKMTVASRVDSRTLGIQDIPMSMTFGIFQSEHVLADATAFEEPLLDSNITVVLLGSKAISVSQWGGGDTRTVSVLLERCFKIAQNRQRIVLKVIQTGS